MSRTNNFDKKYFLSRNWDSTNFHHFCKGCACRYSFKNWIFKNLPKIVEKHFLWWVEQIILTKNIFLAQIEITQFFTIFVRSAPVDIPSKNQNFQKLPKIVEKHFLWWVEQIILTKNILAQIEIIQIFTIFVRVRACRYSFKKSNFQKLPKIVEKHFLWWVEQIILTKNIFLAKIEIKLIFTIFVRVAPVDIPSKIQFSKICLKLWRNTSFDEWNK